MIIDASVAVIAQVRSIFDILISEEFNHEFLDVIGSPL